MIFLRVSKTILTFYMKTPYNIHANVEYIWRFDRHSGRGEVYEKYSRAD